MRSVSTERQVFEAGSGSQAAFDEMNSHFLANGAFIPDLTFGGD